MPRDTNSKNYNESDINNRFDSNHVKDYRIPQNIIFLHQLLNAQDFYNLPKLNKHFRSQLPVSFVVSNLETGTYSLAKCLTTIFAPLHSPNIHITDNKELYQLLKYHLEFSLY